MFEQAFRNIDDVLWKEAGLEQDLADEAGLNGKKYSYILDKPYRWESWAAPKGKDGTLDHQFKVRATGPNTIEYKIGEIFGEIKNKISSGYNMREIIDHIDALRFRSQAEKHELSHLYEAKIRNMGNAGRNGGEYYTPRPLIRAIVHVVKPKIGERIYDGACGSAGFLCESYVYLTETNPKRTTAQDRLLQERTFYGKEKKSLAYVIAIMNMILHGIEAPNILHTNTLTENLDSGQFAWLEPRSLREARRWTRQLSDNSGWFELSARGRREQPVRNPYKFGRTAAVVREFRTTGPASLNASIRPWAR